MKKQLLLKIMVILLFGSSCVTVSIHPIFYDEDRVLYNEIIGEWIDEENEQYIIQPDPEDTLTYLLHYIVEGGEMLDSCETNFELNMIKHGSYYYADCYPGENEALDFENWVLGVHMLFVHSFYRFQVMNDTLYFWSLNGEAFEKWMDENEPDISYTNVEDNSSILFTGSTNEMKNFLLEYESHLDSLFSDMVVLVRE